MVSPLTFNIPYFCYHIISKIDLNNFSYFILYRGYISMKTANLKGYTSSQLLRMSLVLLILVSSFGWSFLTVRPAQAQPLVPAATRTSPLPKKVKPTDAGQIQFGSSAYTTTEGQAGTLITVNRTGSSTGAVTATVVLTDVTTTPSDYQFSSTITPALLTLPLILVILVATIYFR